MAFWVAILLCMVVANLTTLLMAAGLWRWNEKRKLTQEMIRRGNAAYEHLLNNPRIPQPPPTNVTPFKKEG